MQRDTRGKRGYDGNCWTERPLVNTPKPGAYVAFHIPAWLASLVGILSFGYSRSLEQFGDVEDFELVFVFDIELYCSDA